MKFVNGLHIIIMTLNWGIDYTTRRSTIPHTLILRKFANKGIYRDIPIKIEASFHKEYPAITQLLGPKILQGIYARVEG